MRRKTRGPFVLSQSILRKAHTIIQIPFRSLEDDIPKFIATIIFDRLEVDLSLVTISETTIEGRSLIKFEVQLDPRIRWNRLSQPKG